MEIRREELLELFRFEGYIKSKSKFIDRVYSDTLYFSDNPFAYLTWHESLYEDRERMDLLLKTINALCNTDFVFID